MEHVPVLLKETISYLNLKPHGTYVDGTIGSGGHALSILKETSPHGRLIGIDWDASQVELAKERLEDFQDRVVIVNDNFIHLKEILKDLKIDSVDGILLDLGLSFAQLKNSSRGFSFAKEGPLDMRFNKNSTRTASDLVNYCPQGQLEKILWQYGEERWAKRITEAIVRHRKKSPITTTTELSEICKSAIPVKYHPKKIHPATKTFQAFRIAVNDELTNLEKIIKEGVKLLKEKGRFCIISFHSLEDRIVKNSFKSLEKGCVCPPFWPRCNCHGKKELRVINKKPITPFEEEIRANPRARSAKLRATEKGGSLP